MLGELFNGKTFAKKMCTVASRSLGDQIGPPLLFSLRTDYDFDEV